MSEPDEIEIDEDYMQDSMLTDELDWNQLHIEEKNIDDLSYQQEDWISTCY